MKNNKAFTLVELLATIAILAVVLLGCSILYTKIHKDVLEKQYSNTKALVENAAAKYANDSGYTAFFVEELIQRGYIEPDDHDSLYDPRDKSSLNCHGVHVSSDKNGNLIAVMSDKNDLVDGRCVNNDITSTSSKVQLTAKLTGTDTVYPSDRTYTVNGEAYPTMVKVNGKVWTKSQLDVYASFTDDSIDLNGAKIIWNDRQDASTEFIKGGENKKTTTFPESSVYSGSFKADVWTKDMIKYSGKLEIHFDDEAPYIDESRVKLLNPEEEDKWTQGKTVVLTVTDKEGVGLSKIYIGSRPCSDMKTDTRLGQNAVAGLVQTFRVTEEVGAEGKDFNVCAIDKLGNVSSGNTIKLYKIDTTPPDINVKTFTYIANNADSYNGVTPLKNLTNENTSFGDNVWNNIGYAFLLSATDDASGVTAGTWSWNGSGSNSYYNSISKTTVGSTNLTVNKTNFVTLTGGGKRYAEVIYTDEAGNSRTVTVQVNIDVLAPTFDSLSISNQNWTNQNVTATVKHSDIGSGINTNSLKAVCGSNNVGVNASNKTTAGFTDTWSSERNNTCHYEICDNVGNCNNSSDFNIKIDKTLPNITVKYYDYIDENISSYSGKTVLGTYSNSDVTISPWTGKGYGFIITAADAHSNIKTGTWGWNDSGKDSSYTTLSTNLIQTNNISSTQFVSLTGGGKRYGEITFTDNAGNKRTVKVQINVDKSAPSKPNMHFVYGDWSVYGGGWTNKDLYAGWASGSTAPNGSSDTGSGVDHYEVSSDGTNYTTFSYSSSNNIYHMSSEGTHTRYFRAVDKVGNKGAVTTIAGKIDKTKPTCTTSLEYASGGAYSGGWTNKDVTFKLNSCKDNTNGSGLASTYRYTYDASNWTTANVSSGTVVKFNPSDGSNWVTGSRGCVKDNAGNEQCYDSGNVYVDKKKPSISASISNQNWTNSNVTATVTYNDDGSGISTGTAKVICNGTNTAISTSNMTTSGLTDTWSSERNHTCYYQICDAVGNCNNSNSFNIKIDKTAPTISASVSTQSCTTGNVSATINYSDSGSGINTSSLTPVCSSGSTTISGSAGSSSATDLWTTRRNETCWYRICDNLGNCSTSNTFTINTQTSCGSSGGGGGSTGSCSYSATNYHRPSVANAELDNDSCAKECRSQGYSGGKKEVPEGSIEPRNIKYGCNTYGGYEEGAFLCDSTVTVGTATYCKHNGKYGTATDIRKIGTTDYYTVFHVCTVYNTYQEYRTNSRAQVYNCVCCN